MESYRHFLEESILSCWALKATKGAVTTTWFEFGRELSSISWNLRYNNSALCSYNTTEFLIASPMHPHCLSLFSFI